MPSSTSATSPAKKAIGDVSAAITVTPASAIYYPVERRAVSAGIRARF